MIILKIKNVTIQINRKGEKLSVLSSVKTNKYEYLTLSLFTIVSYDKFISSSLGKALKKEADKQVDAIKVFRLF